MLTRGGSRALVSHVSSKLEIVESIIPESEREEEAASFAFPDADLKICCEAMDDWEVRDSLPNVHPAATIVVCLANHAVHSFVRVLALNRRLNKIQIELERANRLATAAAARARSAPEESAPRGERPVAASPAPGRKSGPSYPELAAELALDRDSRGTDSE